MLAVLPLSAFSTCGCKPGSLGTNFELGEECRIQTLECVLASEGKCKTKRLERALIGILQQEGSSEKQAATACFLLGKMKSEKAIPDLIQHLQAPWLRVQFDILYGMSRPSEALIAIGEPALQPLIDAVKNADGQELDLQAAGIIFNIFGGKDRALEFLQEQAGNGSGQDKESVNRLAGIIHQTFNDK